METASPRDFADPVEKVIISGKKDPAGSSSITGLEERYKAGPTDANKFKMDQQLLSKVIGIPATGKPSYGVSNHNQSNT
ncbi:hypothetical protein PCASD_07439 [Puccinia coronata f. sp. avenae]|uniref:Uncharacterized protein n=1 Tax=Puccinia coronata f. sp. avenae TaxID=200324 RepID=A0A2N5TG86_9BASI|nr:hypothetical protein PCASD_07439 [Puccinia coronata f. sp. avenae]